MPDKPSPPAQEGKAETRRGGVMSEEEVTDFLALIVEVIRSVSQVAALFAGREQRPALRDLFLEAQQRSARRVQDLSRLLEKRGRRVPICTTTFFSEAAALPVDADRVAFFARGQSWLIGRLHEAVPQIADAGLAETFAALADEIETRRALFAEANSQA